MFKLRKNTTEEQLFERVVKVAIEKTEEQNAEVSEVINSSYTDLVVQEQKEIEYDITPAWFEITALLEYIYVNYSDESVRKQKYLQFRNLFTQDQIKKYNLTDTFFINCVLFNFENEVWPNSKNNVEFVNNNYTTV